MVRSRTRRTSTDTRGELVGTAVALLAEHGPHGAGLAELLDRSGSARGSLYQHFAGKDDLMVAATRAAGEVVTDRLRTRGSTPTEIVDVLVDGMIAVVGLPADRSCPVLAAAASGTLDLRDAAADVLAEWVDVVATRFGDLGMDDARAREVATTCISAAEGAGVLSRAARSTEPAELVRRQLRCLVSRPDAAP